MAGRGRGDIPPRDVSTSGITSSVYPQRLGSDSDSDNSSVSSGAESATGPSTSGGGQLVRGRGGYRTTELKTIPEGITDKKGTMGQPLKLLTNYIKINLPSAANVYQYHVSFEPNVESTTVRGRLVRESTRALFADKTIYDNGSDIKSPTLLPDETTTVDALHPSDRSPIKIIIKKVGQVDWGAFEMLRMYNTAMRGFLRKMGYFQLRRDFYSDQLKTRLPGDYKMSIVGGYRTAASRHDGGILMNLDSVHKIIQDVTLRDMMKVIHRKGGNFAANCRSELTNALIITRYNNRTYRVEDFKFDQKPTSTFPTREGGTQTYVEYYRRQYPNYPITDLEQPLVVAKPENALRSQRRAEQGQTDEREICLIPELCNLTGLTLEQRSDNRLKMDMIKHSQVSPADRVKNLKTFIRQLNSNEFVKSETQKWNYSYNTDIMQVEGRQLQPEGICWGNMKGQDPTKWPKCDPPGSFDKTLRGATLLEKPSLTKMAFIIPKSCTGLLGSIQSMLGKAMSQIGMPITSDNVNLIQPPDDRTGTLISVCRNLPADTTIVLCLFFRIHKETYDAVKKLLTVERGIPSQCFTARLMSDERKISSACQKIAIQMACKIGGEPWTLTIPSKQTMVCGYDTYHDTVKRGRSWGAFCASMNSSMTRWWSKVNDHDKLEELSTNLAHNLLEAVIKWRNINNCLPARIFIYRDGVSEGQLDHVYNIELKNLKRQLRMLGEEHETIKLSVIIVTKRIGTKFFMVSGSGPELNPPPGTVVDSIVTRQARYDFYLVSQLTRQGTVCPTMYNVIEDTTGLKPMHQQMLAYKLCHLYFNWTGTVRVPAPCQYAHKLAYLVGENLHAQPHIKLENYLHYL